MMLISAVAAAKPAAAQSAKDMVGTWTLVTADAFGPSAAGHVRISLTLPETELLTAGQKIVALAARLAVESPDAVFARQGR